MADNKTIINKRNDKVRGTSVSTISIPLTGPALLAFNETQAAIRVTSDTLANSNSFTSTYNMNIDPYMRLLKNVETDEFYDFYFPFSPGEISYEQLSNEIVEVPRAGRTPLVMYKSQKLMKLSFEFMLAVPFDGMVESVSDSIELLRKMATDTTRSIQFFNFDDMLTKSLFLSKAPVASFSLTETTNRFFIADLTISSIRRNANNQITNANVSMSFIENRNPDITIVNIPKFVKKVVPTCPQQCIKENKTKAKRDKCIAKKCTKTGKVVCKLTKVSCMMDSSGRNRKFLKGNFTSEKCPVCKTK
jgi:hypothetical protein